MEDALGGHQIETNNVLSTDIQPQVDILLADVNYIIVLVTIFHFTQELYSLF